MKITNAKLTNPRPVKKKKKKVGTLAEFKATFLPMLNSYPLSSSSVIP
jgi:hypothetical protein